MTDTALSISTKSFSDIVKLRREFHRSPGLAFQEFNTGKIIAREPKKLSISVKERVGQTGLVGLLEGKGNSGVVALRADMDALPITEESGVPYESRTSGMMHSCGCDAHMATLIGAAMILHELKSELSGTVRFLFRPSEQKNPGGGPSMIRDGELGDPDVHIVLGQHITSDLPVGRFGFRSGPLMASADEIYITIIGKGGHGASPHKAADPIPIAAQTISSLQNVISRIGDPLEPSVLTIGSIHGGSATNVIPDEAELTGIFQAMIEDWRKKALRLIGQTAEQTAQSLGGKCRVVVSAGYPVLVNSEIKTEFVRESTEKIFGKNSVMSAEDFACFLRKTPGTFWGIGAGNRKTGVFASIHIPRFKIDERALMYGAALLAILSIECLKTRGRKN